VVLEHRDVEDPVEARIGGAVTQRIVIDDFVRVRDSIGDYATQDVDDFPVIRRPSLQPFRDLI
jgi:hypothetical protein